MLSDIGGKMCAVKYGVHRIKQLQAFHNIAE